MKHTKGRWYASSSFIGSTEAEYAIANFNGLLPEQEANAKLIAAAPELYEALDELCKLDECDVYTAESWAQSFEKARKALAKARGEA